MSKVTKRKVGRMICELTKLAFTPVTKKVNNKLDEIKMENLKRETEFLRSVLHDERKLLRLPIKNHKTQEKKVDILHARHVALRKELKRLIKAQTQSAN